MKTITLFICIVIIVTFSFMAEVYAETFYLKDGNVVEGKIIKEEKGKIYLEDATVTIKGPNEEGTKEGQEAFMYASRHVIRRDEIETIKAGDTMVEAFTDEGMRDQYKVSKSSEYYFRGVQYAINRKFEEAQKEFSNSLRIDTSYTPAQEAVLLLKQVLNKSIKQESASTIFEIVDSKDWQNAISKLRNIVTLEPNNIVARNLLGVVYRYNRRFDDAKNEFERALQIEPANASIHNNLGVIYAYENMLDIATDEFNNALKFNPNLSEAKFNLEILKESRKLSKEDIATQAILENKGYGDILMTASIVEERY